jgi:hypothetical protein
MSCLLCPDHTHRPRARAVCCVLYIMGYGAHARLKTTLRARTKQQAGAYAWRPTLPYIRLYLESTIKQT